jgi:hypothetical protein
MSVEEIFNELDRLYRNIQLRDSRREPFEEQLTKSLYLQVEKFYPALSEKDRDTKEKVKYQAFVSARELSDFILKRVFDGEEDEAADLTSLHVSSREETAACRTTKLLEKMTPEEQESYREVCEMIEDVNRPYVDFWYDCFECAKKKLCESFPEIGEFSKNSILCLNAWTHDRMWYFRNRMVDIMEKCDPQ